MKQLVNLYWSLESDKLIQQVVYGNNKWGVHSYDMDSIMVVDDAGFMRVLLKDMLIEAGFKVIAEAANGVEAVQSYKYHMPDLVTMDITMPEMDGIAALVEIRKINPKAKVIMCSAMGQQRMVLEAIRSGAKDFLVKPFQKERVIEAINKVLSV